MREVAADVEARVILGRLAAEAGLDVRGGAIRRTSSRFCLGVEHGDYNGTELLGVGTDRFLWVAFKANASGRVRLFSGNFPDDGVVEFRWGDVPAPPLTGAMESWARFPFGVDWVLRRAGHVLDRGLDVVVWGDIPGGGMSRSASLSINLILTVLEVHGIVIDDGLQVVDLARAVETDYVGSPSGELDQIMIYFARAGYATHYCPVDRALAQVPLPRGCVDFRLVSLDTGTVRPGLERSTYAVRRAECDRLVAMAASEFGIGCLADVRSDEQYRAILMLFEAEHPGLCDRLTYVFEAQRRFPRMLDAWRAGDLDTVGTVFREDGFGLRDRYRISGPELDSMCEIARGVAGVFGERLLGGGDKGAAGAVVRADAVPALRRAVDAEFPRRHPELAGRYAVHACQSVDGVAVLPGV